MKIYLYEVRFRSGKRHIGITNDPDIDAHVLKLCATYQQSTHRHLPLARHFKKHWQHKPRSKHFKRSRPICEWETQLLIQTELSESNRIKVTQLFTDHYQKAKSAKTIPTAVSIAERIKRLHSRKFN